MSGLSGMSDEELDLFGGAGTAGANSAGLRLSRLSVEFSKQKARAAALEKQTNAEKKSRESAERQLAEVQLTVHSQESQIETLSFNVNRLTKRCEKLMAQIRHTSDVLKKRSMPNHSWMSSLFEGSWSSGDQRRLASQLQVTKEELSAKIEENERLHIDSFEMDQEHRSTLETVQRKIEDLKQRLAVREAELSSSRAESEQAQQRLRQSDAEWSARVKQSNAQVEEFRLVLEDKEETLQLINRQLDADLRSVQARYAAKVCFDDGLHDRLNALNLPPFDRGAVLTKVTLLRDGAALMGKLGVHLSSLARSFINKLSLPVKPHKPVSHALGLGSGLGFGSDPVYPMSDSHAEWSLEEDREQHALLLSLVTMPTELEVRCGELTRALHDLATELDRQANCAVVCVPPLSLPLPRPAGWSLSASPLVSALPDSVGSSAADFAPASPFGSPSDAAADSVTSGNNSNINSVNYSDRACSWPRQANIAVADLALPASVADRTFALSGLNGLASLVRSASPRSPSSPTLNHSSARDRSLSPVAACAASLPLSSRSVASTATATTVAASEGNALRRSVSAAVLLALHALLESCRRLVSAELDVLEHQKRTESKAASRAKHHQHASSSAYLYSLSLLVQRYRELLSLVQTASAFLNDAVDLQTGTDQPLAFYCGWLFDFILLGGVRLGSQEPFAPQFPLSPSVHAVNSSATAPSDLPFSSAPSSSGSSSVSSPALLLALRRCIASISAQFAATVSAMEQQHSERVQNMSGNSRSATLMSSVMASPSVSMPSKAMKVMYNAIVSEASAVSKLVMQMAERVAEYRRVVTSDPGQSRRHVHLYSMLTLARLDAQADGDVERDTPLVAAETEQLPQRLRRPQPRRAAAVCVADGSARHSDAAAFSPDDLTLEPSAAAVGKRRGAGLTATAASGDHCNAAVRSASASPNGDGTEAASESLSESASPSDVRAANNNSSTADLRSSDTYAYADSASSDGPSADSVHSMQSRADHTLALDLEGGAAAGGVLMAATAGHVSVGPAGSVDTAVDVKALQRLHQRMRAYMRLLAAPFSQR